MKLSQKIKKALKPITKPVSQWTLAITNAIIISAVNLLNMTRGYLITSLRRRNLALRFKALFLASFVGNEIAPHRVGLTPENCGHAKGGQLKRLSPFKDYNVIGHTFADGTRKIWCANGCGFKSEQGDANWERASWMMENSSNRMSASERVFPGVKTEEYFKDVIVTVQDKIDG